MLISFPLRPLTIVAALSLSACATPPAPASVPDLTTQDLLGTWDVALYFSPDSPPSATLMEIDAVNEDGTLNGRFYGTDFEIGRYTPRDNAIIISAITSDGSGPYATSGRLVAPDRVEGQTLSTGRDFLMAWSATKRAEIED